MSKSLDADVIRKRAEDLLAKLAGLGTAGDLDQAKQTVEELRNVREYDAMGRLAEAVSRRDPADATNRRLYGQYLIETGKATAAIDVLTPLAAKLPKKDKEYAEATGLLGRAHKQIFFDAGDKTSEGARLALKQAIDAYRAPYEKSRANTWHGVNLIALLRRARGLGLRYAPGLDPQKIAKQVVTTLEQTPEKSRDEWFLPTIAEASLAVGEWGKVEEYLKEYVAPPKAKAFQVASTLRQFTQVWDLENSDPRGRALVNILRARLMDLPEGNLAMTPEQLQKARGEDAPTDEHLQAILGVDGPKLYTWWKAGLDRALSVCAVRRRLGRRTGSGWLVRAGDLGRAPADELLVLTNFHVVNEEGVLNALRPGDAEVVFEAVDGTKSYPVNAIVKSSPVERHDVTLLRLEGKVTGVEPLPIAAALPKVEKTARVYVIGHPGGRELAFSFQDNELLDHEGPPDGHPQIADVCRLHYGAPTQPGSSGSPVFGDTWQVIGLHHKGGTGMGKLNGKEGTYGANEAIWIQSIKELLKD